MPFNKQNADEFVQYLDEALQELGLQVLPA